jgi:hypothetical protein
MRPLIFDMYHCQCGHREYSFLKFLVLFKLKILSSVGCHALSMLNNTAKNFALYPVTETKYVYFVEFAMQNI